MQNIKHHYKPTWIAFGSLQKKKLIQKVNSKKYRGREYSQYWLTEKGVIYALAKEMNPQKLLVHTENVYGKNSLMALLVKLAQALGPKAYRFCLNLMLDKGLTEESVSIALNTSLIYASQLSGKNPQTLMKEILTVLKDFPQFYSLYKQTFHGIKKGILSLSEIVEGVKV
ncbi:MAG: hypothetical protein QXJ11_06890 [Candidatus Bathyarchaeia archaeon]